MERSERKKRGEIQIGGAGIGSERKKRKDMGR
jgi:hypothetical protein